MHIRKMNGVCIDHHLTSYNHTIYLYRCALLNK